VSPPVPPVDNGIAYTMVSLHNRLDRVVRLPNESRIEAFYCGSDWSWMVYLLAL
jgi:hypothetical protein